MSSVEVNGQRSYLINPGIFLAKMQLNVSSQIQFDFYDSNRSPQIFMCAIFRNQ